MKDITKLAQTYNVTTRTIRYYEELGMLKPERTPGNKRIYPKSEIVKMKLIVRGKKYGFTLDEIKEMILLFNKDRTGKQQLERTIEFGKEKILQVEEKIKELEDIKKEMEQLLVVFNKKLHHQ
ncbi:MerR family transcriptional regulator [Sporosarcina sp. FA9]|uniref:MerR family transcriptional regulator n=1 Tax=Sporosarcina sp. FA9 TaxID=3413030 RepID=UPI003F658620